MNEIKVVLWDIDGTLLDFHPAERHAIQACFEAFELPRCTDAMVQEYSSINKKYWLAMEQGRITKEQVLVGRFREFFANQGIDPALAEKVNAMYQVRLGDGVYFFPDALETVKACKAAGILQCAVTNGTKVAQVRKLSKSGLDKILDYVFISEDVGFEKPAQGFFQRVFGEIGDYKPEEIMIVGDSLTSDMRGGRDAGIHTCWFNPRGTAKNFPIKTEYEILNISQVKDILSI